VTVLGATFSRTCLGGWRGKEDGPAEGAGAGGGVIGIPGGGMNPGGGSMLHQTSTPLVRERKVVGKREKAHPGGGKGIGKPGGGAIPGRGMLCGLKSNGSQFTAV